MEKSLTVLLVLIFALAGCSGGGETSQKTKEYLWVEKGKDRIKARLKDGDSVKFRNVYFHKGKSGVPAACGEVDSKNGYGGYGGYSKFVSAGEKFTYIESDISDFKNFWTQMCE